VKFEKDRILWAKKFSAVEFFNSGAVNEMFDQVLQRCVYEKRAFQLEFGEGQVEVRLLKSSPDQQRLELEGSSLVGISDIDVSSTGGRLILPLTVSVSSIYLPESQIYAIRRGQRTIAEFFTRNLFMALARGDADIEVLDEEPTQGQIKLTDELMTRYIWIFRHFVKDKFLQPGSTVEKLLINLFVETDAAETKLLGLGMSELRNAFQDQFSNSPDHLLREYKNVRQRVLSHF